MSGLDTSQDVTVDASKHADEKHEHSRKPALGTADGTRDDEDGTKDAKDAKD